MIEARAGFPYIRTVPALAVAACLLERRGACLLERRGACLVERRGA